MPRAIVGPGSRSKRSCSSDSICRGAYLRLCATSSIARPCASRACRRRAPIPVSSVKLTPLQRLIFGGARETPPQLVGVALLGNALARFFLDAQRKPQRFRARLRELVVARDVLARLLDASLAVADLAEVEKRGGL